MPNKKKTSTHDPRHTRAERRMRLRAGSNERRSTHTKKPQQGNRCIAQQQQQEQCQAGPSQARHTKKATSHVSKTFPEDKILSRHVIARRSVCEILLTKLSSIKPFILHGPLVCVCVCHRSLPPLSPKRRQRERSGTTHPRPIRSGPFAVLHVVFVTHLQ